MLLGGSPGGVERIDDHVGDHADRVLEDFAAFHPEMADGLGRGRTAVDKQLCLMPSVGTQMRRQYATVGRLARLVLGLEHDGAGAVAEQHAGAAVAPVENARERLRADHQRPLVRAGAQEIVGGRQRKDEAGADRLQVEGDAMIDAQRVLDRDRGRRKGVVRRRGRQHDQIDLLRVDAGMVERGARGVDRQMRGELALCGDVALPDAGALHDPLVRGIDPGSQFGIGQDLPRQIGAAAEHDRTFRSHETASCAVCA